MPHFIQSEQSPGGECHSYPHGGDEKTQAQGDVGGKTVVSIYVHLLLCFPSYLRS